MAALANCNESLGALYFINGRGDVLIQRIYRDDIECVGDGQRWVRLGGRDAPPCRCRCSSIVGLFAFLQRPVQPRPPHALPPAR